jgi:hypothetical protein
MSATKEPTGDFGSVTDDPAATMLANRSNSLNRTLEAVKNVMRSRSNYFEAFVIFISADFTLGH